MKKPLGKLIRGNEKDVASLLKKNFREWKPKVVVAVGDKVSSTLNSIGVHPKLTIYDKKIERKVVSTASIECFKTVNIKNPAGMLRGEALNSVRLALKSNVQIGLRVEGEEDLLTLPAILYSPLGALVVYGQPGEGVVLVKVTKNKKEYVEKIMKKMRVVS